MGFDFQAAFNLEAARKVAQDIAEKQKSRGGSEFWSQDGPGTAQVRVLPPGNMQMMSRGKMGVVIYKHFIHLDSGLAVHKSGPMTDPETYKSCPIQDALDRIHNNLTKEQLYKMRASPRSIFNLLLRQSFDSHGKPVDQEMWGKPVIYEGPSGFYEWVQQTFLDNLVGFFIDPFKGCDVLIRKTGSGLETKYTYQLKPGDWGLAVGNTREETEALIEKLPDLTVHMRLSEEEQRKQQVTAQAILQWAQRFGYKGDGGAGVGPASGVTPAGALDLSGVFGQQGPERRAPAASQPAATGVGLVLGVQASSVALAAPVSPPATPTSVAPVTPAAPVAGAVQPPALGPDGSPVCFRQWAQRNPGVADDRATDAQCKICDFRMPCSFG